MADVTDNAELERFEIHTDGELAGFAQYRRRDGRIVYFHTEVDDAYEGQGLGSQLVRAALDASRAAGEVVEPKCPFFKSYIEKHPEYADLTG